MLSGVGTICFASSYAIAWALEISRLLFRSGVRGAVMLGFAGAGLVAHTAFLYYLAIDATGSPLSSEKDWFLVAAWAMVVVYLHLALVHPKIPFGLFLLPLVLGLIGAGTFFAPTEPLAREPASRIWGAIHGVSIVLAAVSVLVGFMAGLMYLGQSRRLKHKRPPTGRLRLPSLEWLERANSHAIFTSLVMLGVGILSGMVLNLVNIHNEATPLYWSDPVVVSTWLMFFWLLAAVGAIVFYRPARQGRKVACLTVASFVFLAIMLAAGLAMDSRHWGRGERGEGRGARKGALAIENWPLKIGHCNQPIPMTNDKFSIRNDQFVAILSPFSAFTLPPSASCLPPLPTPLSPLPFSRGGRPC